MSEDKPPTLASLRTRRAKVRSGKRSPSASAETNSFEQTGLFSGVSGTPELLDNQPAVTSKIYPIATERRIWSVRALVTDIRQQVETKYTDLWVEGEISNCRPAPSDTSTSPSRMATLNFPSFSSAVRRAFCASDLWTALLYWSAGAYPCMRAVANFN